MKYLQLLYRRSKVIFDFLLPVSVSLVFICTSFAVAKDKKKEPGKSRAEVLSMLAPEFLDAIIKGESSVIEKEIDEPVKEKLPASVILSAWKKTIKTYGPVEKIYQPRIESLGPFKLAHIAVQFKKKLLDVSITYSYNGKVSGFFIVPHKTDYAKPPYVEPDKFVESSIRFGEGKWKLWGKLCVPKGEGPYPVLVFVHGSGPQDMDESVGSLKPFMDIAHGLASLEVATFRYTKRTKEYKLGKEDTRNMTVKDETIDDLIAAVEMLKSNEEINPDRIYVLGHSLGGMLIPRFEAADQSIAGYICLAGSSIPLDEKVIEQAKYLADFSDKETAEKQVSEARKISREVKAVVEANDLSNEKMIFGAPASYWIDLSQHDPIKEIKEMKRPVCFLQGGRDYQVTEFGDFQRWKDAVKNMPDSKSQFEFKLYPSLNHLFIAGKGKSTPQEYINTTANVPKEVVVDIADWIKRH